MAVSIADLVQDLHAETEVLTACLEELAPADWVLLTPAEGWTVLDQVSHLAFFDRAVTTAVTDPDRFRRERDEALRRPGSMVDAIAAASRGRAGADVQAEFTSARRAMVDAFLAADPGGRVPWYGPEMSVAAALTARIMETWAHGQDVFDAVARPHPITSALRQVAHIGVRALPNSFITRGREVPLAAVGVALTAPSGEVWTWGPQDSADRVTGPAVDFCLVVTQRRHLSDTAVVTTGAVAGEWMSIAQAFAGAPGAGRAPGQRFSRSG
jgi:uncharacterized protein (TIGR03084 family)